MSQEQPMQSRALAGGQKIRVRLDQLKSSPGLNVIGLPELIGLAAAAVLALITIFAYFYFLVPANSRLTSSKLDRDRLQGVLSSSQTSFKEGTNARAIVDKDIASLEDFEINWLAAPDSGRMSLYAELNNLIRSNALRNTSGPSYAALRPLGTKSPAQPSATAQQQTNEKWQTMESTVFGHPGEPKAASAKVLADILSVQLGVNFETQGLSAKAVLNRKPGN